MISDKFTLHVTPRGIKVNGKLMPRCLTETSPFSELQRMCLSLEYFSTDKALIKKINKIKSAPWFTPRVSDELSTLLSRALAGAYHLKQLKAVLSDLEAEWLFNYKKWLFESKVNALRVDESVKLKTFRKETVEITRFRGKRLKVKLTPSLSVVLDGHISAVPGSLFVGVSINSHCEIIKDVIINDLSVDENAAVKALKQYETFNPLTETERFKKRLLRDRITTMKRGQIIERKTANGVRFQIRRVKGAYHLETSLKTSFTIPAYCLPICVDGVAEVISSKKPNYALDAFWGNCSKITIDRKTIDHISPELKILVARSFSKNVPPSVGALIS